MKLNRDHFDRGFASSTERSNEKEPERTYFTSKRGPRHVGQTTCPHCFHPGLGITHHGQLSSGQHVYELAVHSPGARSKRHGQPECKGSRVRLEKLTDGTWRKA